MALTVPLPKYLQKKRRDPRMRLQERRMRYFLLKSFWKSQLVYPDREFFDWKRHTTVTPKIWHVCIIPKMESKQIAVPEGYDKLVKHSHELADELGKLFGLPPADADPNALLRLDGFLADLSDKNIDVPTMISEARRRL